MKEMASWMPVTKVRHKRRKATKLLGCREARQYWLEELRKDRDDIVKDCGLPILCDGGLWLTCRKCVVCKECRRDGFFVRMLVQVL